MILQTSGLQVLPDPDDGLQEALCRIHRQPQAGPPQGWHEGGCGMGHGS